MEKQKELIKKYIKRGIILDVIALELGVSLELVKQCKQELLIEQHPHPSKPIKAIDSNSYIKMKIMREKYDRLLSGKKGNSGENEEEKEEENKKKKLSEEEIREAEALIASIEQKIGLVNPNSRIKTREVSLSIISDIRQLQEYTPLPYEMAVKYKAIISTLHVSKILYREKDGLIIKNISDSKKSATDRVIKAIEILAEEATSIEELQDIYRKLTPEMEKERKIAVSSLKCHIQKRISDLQLKIAIEKMKNIPQSLSDMIEKFLDGEIDIQEANSIIVEEAKKRVASRPKSRFSVTEEQEKRQISMQIKSAIREHPDRYNIKNPELAIEKVHQLCGGEQCDAIGAIVSNLIGKKHFETAKRICRKYSQIENQSSIPIIYIRRLQEDIKNAEISDMVLRGINMKGTPQEEGAYYEVLEMGIKRGNVSLGSVSLGKSKDGLRNITLADIWLPEGKNKKGIKR